MDINEIVYQITIEDIQTVANQELDRDLTAIEVEDIRDLIGEKIAWYEAILDSINEKIGSEDISEQPFT